MLQFLLSVVALLALLIGAALNRDLAIVLLIFAGVYVIANKQA